MTSGVYEIVNNTNGKRYIGSAVRCEKRWREHRRDLAAGKHHSRALQRAYDKYGHDAFRCGVLIVCSRSNLIMYEQLAFDALVPQYNTCPKAGSALGMRLSAETRAKMSAARRGQVSSMLGRKHSEEARAKMSASRMGNKNSVGRKDSIGRVYSAQARTNMSAAIKGRTLSQEHRDKLSTAQIGRSKHSPGARARIAAAMTGRVVSAETRARASAAKMGNTYKTGKKCSLEARARMVAAWEQRRQ